MSNKNRKKDKKVCGKEELSICVAQIGALMHYAVPRSLEKENMLKYLYTDICATKSVPNTLQKMLPRNWTPSRIKSLFDRIPHGVPKEKIIDYPFWGLRLALRRYLRSTLSRQTRDFIWRGKEFGTLVNNDLPKNIDGIYTFKTSALEILKKYSGSNVFTVVEQPNVHRSTMNRLLKREYELFGKWTESMGSDQYMEKEIEREREEWSHADLIVCPSEFVQKGVQEGGGPVERTALVPYGIDFKTRSTPRRRENSDEFNVLSVGIVGLRKGAPYLKQAAELINANFRFVGPSNLSPYGETKLSQSVDLPGQVPRSEIHRHYEWADVFVLPSICEGSATVVYEALAQALPVICTPNTGSIIRDEVEGFIVPIRDGNEIADRLEKLRSDQNMYNEISKNALDLYKRKGSLNAFSKRISKAIKQSYNKVLN